MTSSSPASSNSACTTALAYASVSSGVSFISPDAQLPSSRLRRAVLRSAISSSCANLASNARSRSSKVVMDAPCKSVLAEIGARAAIGKGLGGDLDHQLPDRAARGHLGDGVAAASEREGLG